jgi:hypothetical protein
MVIPLSQDIAPPPRSSQGSTQGLVAYSGTITKRVSDSVFILDNRAYLYLTHLYVPNGGRGLREGTKVNLYNAHVVVHLGKFKVLYYDKIFNIP